MLKLSLTYVKRAQKPISKKQKKMLATWYFVVLVIYSHDCLDDWAPQLTLLSSITRQYQTAHC